MNDRKERLSLNLEFFSCKSLLTNPSSSVWHVRMMEAEVWCGSFQHLPIWCEIYCQHAEDFSEGSSRKTSTAALLSPVSGKVYINTEKHPENISFPIQSNRRPLNKLIQEVWGNGKIWFLTEQKIWANGKLLGNVTMAVWAGFMIVSKRPSWLVESGTPWGGMQPPWAPHATQYVLRMDFAPSKAPSGQNRISLKQKGRGKKSQPEPTQGLFLCFPNAAQY